MRASLLLPLLPLLLHGVSSEDNDTTTASSGETKQITTATVTTSTVQESSSTSKPKSTSPTTVMSSTAAQGTATASKPHSSSAPSIPPSSVTATQRISTTISQGITPSTPTSTHTSAQTTKTPDRSDPSHVLETSTTASQQVSSSAISMTPTTTSAATSSATQQMSPPDNSRTSLTKPSASPTSTQVTSPSSTLVSTVSVSPHSGSPASDSTVSSSGVSTSSPVVKDSSVSSTISATNQHHPSTASPVQKCEFTTPRSGSVSSTSSKTSLSPPSGTTKKATVITTMTTAKADPAYTSQGDRSVTHKPGVTAESPTSASKPTPTLGDQMESKRPDQPHVNMSFQNEVICEDKIQETWPIINLKEAKICDDWKNDSANESFFEFFCSEKRHAFDSKRDRCTVTLASSNPHRWSVHPVVHRLLDPEAVFEVLKEKRNELQKLGITNVTYLNREMEEEIKDQFSTPLIITIVTLAGSLLLVAAIYGCCHQRFSQKKSQHIHPDLPGFDDGRAILIFNRLTEELQTMENGYHDNPTLEVMETGSEMQEKKVNLNGELGDSWIVPLDTIMKEDLEEEEDTHL
ncbi:podocalyxin isoform X2 [Phasianus colchicus]|uniref:podocalyxin isoform X2 n=1 Tax=Phasianus colchicus TaxID=9054 RepID=UPI00129EFBD1|nr:podocalyxin isoform X2 [Phasianus colchicus]